MIKTHERFTDATLQEFFTGLFPRDNPRNTRFAINFFTSIGLGPLTDELRAHLKLVPKLMPPVVLDEEPVQKEHKKKKKSKKSKSKKSKKKKESSSSRSSSSESDSSTDDEERMEEKLKKKLK